MTNSCELQAVVVSSDPALVKSILPCLENLGIVPSVYTEPASALETLTRQKIDAFFVDRDLDPELSVVKCMRSSPSSRAAVAFAIVPGQTSAGEASRVADFVVDKPLAPDTMNRSLRAAYGIMLKERKRYFRHALRVPVDLTDSSYRRFTCETINISQAGMAIACAGPVATRDIVQLDFHLPGIGDKIEAKAQIIWTAQSDKAGLTFTHMSSSDRQRLMKWLEEEFNQAWSMVPPTPAAARLNRVPQYQH